MKSVFKLSIFFIFTFYSYYSFATNGEEIKKYGPSATQVEIIDKASLKKHLSFIASDELKGRNTGSHELDIAAKYLAVHLEYFGYKGLGEGGSFFQDVPLYQNTFDLSTTQISFAQKPVAGTNGKDYAIFAQGDKSLDFNLPLISVGDGVFTDSIKDYKPEDVEGKAVIRFDLTGEKAKLANKSQKYIHQMIRNKLYEQKAKLVIMVVDNAQKAANLIQQYAQVSNNSVLTLDADTVSRAYMIITKEMLQKILTIEKGKDLPRNQVVKLKNNIQVKMKSSGGLVMTRNVVAYLEGTDSLLKNEHVGYGAHYDHIGEMNGKIYNGANDDGSGTVGLLKIAEAIALNPPKRSTFIIFHTGEEKGLFGSEYYTNHPLLPLENMVTMLNMDMIGSDYKPDQVSIVGPSRLSNELEEINEVVNSQTVNLKLDYTFDAENHPERIYYRSDHYNYAKQGIPVIFYTDEDPKHYHKDTDEVQYINFDKLQKVSQLALSTGYYIANKPERLKLNSQQPAGSQ